MDCVRNCSSMTKSAWRKPSSTLPRRILVGVDEVGAVALVHERGARQQGLLGVEHRRQRLASTRTSAAARIARSRVSATTIATTSPL
jgi:hypothetical protein